MKSWMKFGIGWGIFMFFLMNIGFPVYDGVEIDIKKCLFMFPLWIIFGLLFGYFSRKKGPKKQIDE